MKTLRAAFLIAVALAAISFARAEDSKASKEDLSRLQGEWAMVSGTANGFEFPDTMVSNSKRICKGSELTAIVGGQLIMKAKISIDASKKPKTIDYDVAEGANEGKKLLGIYELDGDSFKSCFGAPGAARPTDFTSKEGDYRTSTAWKKAKTPAKPEQK